MTTKHLSFVSATTSNEEGVVIEYDVATGGSGWRVCTESPGFELARKLGGTPPRIAAPNTQYSIPICLPRVNPLAVINDALKRLGESDTFTKLFLWYRGNGNDEVEVQIYEEGLCVGFNQRTFDRAAANRVATAVSKAIGLTVTAKPEPNSLYIMVTIRRMPAEDAHDEMLEFCHEVAEAIYMTP